jgi:hypothetical protein
LSALDERPDGLPLQVLDTGLDAVRYLLDPRAVIVPGEDDADAVILFKEFLEPIPKSPKGVIQGVQTRPKSLPVVEPDTDDDLISLKRPLLQALQDALRLGMRALDEGKEWVPEIGAPKTLIRRRVDGTLERSYYGGPILPVLLASAIDLLVQFWPQMLRCEYASCRKFFIPTHGRQKYHNQHCAAVDRKRRFLRNAEVEKQPRVLKNGPGRGKTRQKKERKS